MNDDEQHAISSGSFKNRNFHYSEVIFRRALRLNEGAKDQKKNYEARVPQHYRLLKSKTRNYDTNFLSCPRHWCSDQRALK